MRAAPLLLVVLTLAGCPGSRKPAPPTPTPAPAPRLVVLVVVDQLPAWSFPAKAAASRDGVARLLRDGRRYAASYPYAATQTAPGHALLGTGTTPSVNGILSNEWWDRQAGRDLKAAEDPAGGPPSAARLRVAGLADALLAARPTARAVAVALKDRSAILTLGHAGLPLWYDHTCVCFVTAGEPPAWLAAQAATAPIAPRLAEPWRPVDPARLAELSGGPDDAPGELAIPGWGATFPHALRDTPEPARSLIDTPLGDAIVLETALAALRGEGLGDDEVADLLVVSFSAHDYVGHAFGPDSWEAWDAWLRLDQQLGALLRALDAEVGAGRWSLVMTSDHGAPELPERRVARGLPGGRLAYETIAAVAQDAAVSAAGPGDWIASTRYPTIYLSDAARALPADRRDALIAAVVAAVARLPGIARADRAADLTGDCARRDGDDRAICLSLDAERSGEIFFAPAEGTNLHSADWVDAVAHGSLHAYDRDVPVVLFGPDIAAGAPAAPVSTLQIAPTVAALLGVPPPAAATAPALPLR